MTVLAALAVTGAPSSLAATPLLIWPVDPEIRQDQGSAALWLENRGDQPAMMQVRIFRWTQQNGEDRHEDQQDILPSPPIMTIPPGAKQMVRLTSPLAARPVGESAYRIIVDEIPTSSGADTQHQGGAGIRFQMRYSIPLFVHGGQPGGKRRTRETDKEDFRLHCTLIDRPDGRRVRITNSGANHIRLTNVAFVVKGIDVPLAKGLLGYVLTGSSMSWPLPKGISGQEPLTMTGPDGHRLTMTACSNE
ncbi:MAG: molecular chaperone [Sphingobium sp.]